MKKGFIIASCLCVLLFSGCTTKKEETTIKRYATDYYEKFMKGYTKGNDVVEISIEMLENSNKLKETSYDLEKLKGCTSSSKIIFNLKKNSDEIKNIEYKLNCK